MHPLTEIQNLNNTIKELERLLKFRVLDGNVLNLGDQLCMVGNLRRKEPICKFIELILEHHNSGNFEFRQYGLCRLAMLILDLQMIEKHNLDLLRMFQRRFKRVSGNEYGGLRFEIDLAATLVGKNIAFQKGEFLLGGDAMNADFVVRSVAIECISIRVDKHRFSTFFSKLQSAIHSKREKPYCGPTTALFVDVTNLFQHRLLLNLPVDGEGFRNTIRKMHTTTAFGSIVLSLWLLNKDTPEVLFQNLFIREDHPNIDHGLQTFLANDFGLDKLCLPIHRFKPVGSY